MPCDNSHRIILLDTHIWVRWLSGEQFPDHISSSIEKTDDLAISAVSCWELMLLSQRGRIELPMGEEKWIAKGLASVGIQCLSLPHRSPNTIVILRIE
uniref:PIN domain-containing protein n=1 Tax=Candidatus Kentrum sp. MB TaxID=2138164 RepID=A0A450XN24_9GAMM|nr:MAG: PIN domain-containing protein [Candidatus Kentron sp. MB]